MNLINLMIFNLFLMIMIIPLNSSNKSLLFLLSLLWSMVNLMIFLVFFMILNQSFPNQMSQYLNWIPNSDMNLNWGDLMMMMDGMSLVFIGLSILLTPICLLVSYHTIKNFYKEFIILLYLNLIFLLMVFSIFDILGFYMLFESILIPIFMMMGLWGSSIEKIKAAFYFFFYTLVGSLLMLLSIFKIYHLTGSCNYENLINIILPEKTQLWLFVGFFLSLSVKVPMIPFHMWLPQAHVEAPMAGSILLAGILLKLGGYGFMSFSFPLFPLAAEYFTPLMLILSLISMIFGALTTCSQMDMKSLMAYSSVSHMGLVTMSMFCHSIEGLMASMLMMLAHGLVSSGLFMFSSMLYWSFHSSVMKYFKGLTYFMPILSLLVFMLILGNMSFPLTFNFMAELFSLVAMMKHSLMLGVLCCIGSFLGVIYSFYLYNSIFFGGTNKSLIFPSDLNLLEFNSFLPLMILTLFLGILPNFVMNLMNLSSLINMSL